MRGLLYDSLRRRTGVNVVALRSHNITDIVQTDHFEIVVLATARTIDVRNSRFEKTADRRTFVLRNFPAARRLQIAALPINRFGNY